MVEEEKMEISMYLGRRFSQTQASLGFGMIIEALDIN